LSGYCTFGLPDPTRAERIVAPDNYPKKPPAEAGGSFFCREALLLRATLSAVLAALTGLLVRLLVLLVRLLLSAALLATTLTTLVLTTLILIILSHKYLPVFS
jgi:hypothetical protein